MPSGRIELPGSDASTTNILVRDTADVNILVPGYAIVQRVLYTAGELVPAQLTVDQANFHPPGLENAVVMFLTSSGPVNITGISYISQPAAGPNAVPVIYNANGRHLFVYNGGGQPITLKHLFAGAPVSQPENRMLLYGNADNTLNAGRCAHLYHSLAAGNVWVQIGQ